MKRLLTFLGTTALLLLLSGCDLTVTNLTPSILRANPSNIHTLSVRVEPRRLAVDQETLDVKIVIDGQILDMRRSDVGGNLYDFDYVAPPGRDEIAYYFIVTYHLANRGDVQFKEQYTDIFRGRIVGRYVLALEVNRGPVGARISIVGRGFSAHDTVLFDGEAIRTVYDSPNAVSFNVPPVAPGRNYAVALRDLQGVITPVDTFRVDLGSLSVSPTSLALDVGQAQTLTFTLPTPAPAGGLFLDLTTDIPDSIIMPEVFVPAGQASATVEVTGGTAGMGNLFLKGYGSGELSIPVSVR